MSWETRLSDAALRTEMHLRKLRTDVERLSESLSSRRERIATAAMAALLSGRGDYNLPRSEAASRLAVEYADALIAELDRPKEGDEG